MYARILRNDIRRSKTITVSDGQVYVPVTYMQVGRAEISPDDFAALKPSGSVEYLIRRMRNSRPALRRGQAAARSLSRVTVARLDASFTLRYTPGHKGAARHG